MLEIRKILSHYKRKSRHRIWNVEEIIIELEAKKGPQFRVFKEQSSRKQVIQVVFFRKREFQFLKMAKIMSNRPTQVVCSQNYTRRDRILRARKGSP